MRAQSIEQEAAQWLAARDAGPLTPEREAALQAWLGASDRHAAALVRLQTCWDEADHFRRLRAPDQPLNLDLLQTPAKPALWRRQRFWLAAAACIVIATGLSFAMHQFWGTQRYSTVFGGLARIPLADGSVVTLNTDSEVKVHLTDRRRELTLVRGEAQFIVAHDVNRPFDVHAGNRTIRAVGTAFSVRWFGGDDINVIVTSGRVAIVPLTVKLSEVKLTELPTTIPTVNAGERAKVGAHDAVQVSKLGAAAQQAMSWTQGRLWFDRLSLAQAVAEFNRYNRRQFVIDDPTIAEVHIGGAFDAADMESFAAALKTFGVTIDESDPNLIKLSKEEP